MESIKNNSFREVSGILLDKLPLGVENVRIITSGAKLKEIGGEKFIVYYFKLKPKEELVIEYEMEFPFEPVDIKLPKPIVR